MEINSPEFAKAVQPLLAQAVEAALKPFTDKLTKMESDATAIATARQADEKKQSELAVATAKAALEPHIKRGAIAPQDKDTIAFWEAQLVATPAIASAQLSKMKGVNGFALNLPAPADTTGAVLPHEGVIAKAKEAMTANPTRFKSLAQAMQAQMQTPDGDRAYRSYRDLVVAGDARFPQMQVSKASNN